jgi:diguanylate cyclase (GGDEF)-like protein/PAS domain S-box-containing protein
MGEEMMTKAQLIREVSLLRLRIAELEGWASERVQQARVGRSQEDLFVQVARHFPGSVYIKDADRRIVYLTENVEQYFGVKPDEWLGKTSEEIWPEELATDVRRHDEAVLRGETVKSMTIRPQGDSLQTWVTYRFPIHGHEGPPFIGCISFDITEYKQTEAIYERLMESSLIVVFIVQDGRFRFINTRVLEVAGYQAGELIGRDADILIHPEDRDEVKKRGREILCRRHATPIEYRIVTKQGRIKWIMQVVSPIHFNGERAMLGNAMDITDRKQAEEAIRLSEEKYRMILDNIEDGYYETDAGGNFTVVNDSACRILGYPLEEMTGLHYSKVTDDENARKMYKAVISVVRTGVPSRGFVHEIIRKDGTKGYVESSISLMRDIAGQMIGLRGIIRDVTERKRAEETIRQMAHHDALTGLPNRKLFADRFGIAIAQGRRNNKEVGIAMIDLDGFKDVNDTLGHDVGDLLLKSVSERLINSLRTGDTVARFGGDEFVLILPELKDITDAISVVQKIVEALRKPFLIDSPALQATASIGIALYPVHGMEADMLLKKADAAMYQAKQGGRNRYHVYEEA